MAEVARLGLEIDAKGVAETRAELLALARSAQETARSFASAGQVIESTGGKIGNAPAGFEQFGTTVDKTTKRATQSIASFRVLSTIMRETGESYGLASEGAGVLTAQLLKLGPVVTVAAAAIVGVGLGYRIATGGAKAFENELDKIGAMTRNRDLSGLTAEVVELDKVLNARAGMWGAIWEPFQQAIGRIKGDIRGITTSNLLVTKDLAEDSIWAQQKAKQQDVSRGIKEQIRLIGASIPDAMRAAGESVQTNLVQGFKAAGMAASLAEKKAKDLADELTGKKLAQYEQQNTNAIDLEHLKAAAIGATGDALLEVNLAMLENSAATRKAAGEDANFVNAQTAIQAAALKTKEVMDKINRGKQGTTDFQNQFGVTFDFERQKVGDQLASQFGAIFNTFKNDRSAQGQLSQAFGSLVQQAVELGVPDVSELIAEKIGGANFERLRQTLGPDLKNKLDASRQSGQQWGDSWRKTMETLAENFADAGQTFDGFNKKAKDAEQKVAGNLALKLDTSQATKELDKITAKREVDLDVNNAHGQVSALIGWINAIPDTIKKTIEITEVRKTADALPAASSERANPNQPQGLTVVNPVPAMDQAKQSVEALKAEVGGNLSLNMEVSQALAAIDSVKVKLAEIPAVTIKSLEIVQTGARLEELSKTARDAAKEQGAGSREIVSILPTAEALGGERSVTLDISQPLAALASVKSELGGIPDITRKSLEFTQTGVRLDELSKEYQDIWASAAGVLTMSMNVSQPLAGIASVKSELGGIPEVTRKSVELGINPDQAKQASEALGSIGTSEMMLNVNATQALTAVANVKSELGGIPEVTRKTIELGISGDEAGRLIETMNQALALDLAMTLDVTQPLSAVDQVRQKLDAIPAVTRKTVIIDYQTTGLLPGLERQQHLATGDDSPWGWVAN